MKTLLKITFGVLLAVVALGLHLDAGVTASIQASAHVIEPVGFLPGAISGMSYNGVELPYMVKPANGSYRCLIEFDDTVISDFTLNGSIDSTAIKSLYSKLAAEDPSTIAITIIYTEN